MKLTEDLANYIIGLQGIAELECGSSTKDLEVRHKLELEFPNLRRTREETEFNNWLWSQRTEEESDVVEARALLGGDIPFDEVYAGRGEDPQAEGSTYKLYSEHISIASRIFQEVKIASEVRLRTADTAGRIDLHSEWRKHQKQDEEEHGS